MSSVGIIKHGDSASREMSERLAGYFATTTLLAGLPADYRVHGQMAVVGQTVYVFDENATVGGVAPSAGSGRWVAPGAGSATPKVLVARNMTTGALGAYTRTGNTITADANGAVGAIDGVTNVVGDILFLNTGAAAAADVGLYAFTAVGGASAKYSMTRIPEFDSSAEVVPGTIVVVAEGTANADTAYILSTNAPITLNTTNLAFTALPNYVDLAATTSGAGADFIGIKDTNNKITATNVGDAFDELTATTGASRIGAADSGNYFTGTQVEAQLQELGADRVYTASKAIGFAEVAALGAVTDGSIDFDAALPAGAVRLATYLDVTAIFDNVGDTASLTADVGQSGGDTDGWIDGGSLNAVAKVASPVGVLPPNMEGGQTPSVLVHSDVNCDTITKGAMVAYVKYLKPY